jgi:hypothetical protein
MAPAAHALHAHIRTHSLKLTLPHAHTHARTHAHERTRACTHTNTHTHTNSAPTARLHLPVHLDFRSLRLWVLFRSCGLALAW